MKYKYTTLMTGMIIVAAALLLLDFMYNTALGKNSVIVLFLISLLGMSYILEKRTSFIEEMEKSQEEKIKEYTGKIIHRMKHDKDFYEHIMNKLENENLIKMKVEE